MKLEKIKDIYTGKYITVWEDGKLVYLSIYSTTIGMPKIMWKKIKKELKNIK